MLMCAGPNRLGFFCLFVSVFSSLAAMARSIFQGTHLRSSYMPHYLRHLKNICLIIWESLQKLPSTHVVEDGLGFLKETR